MHPAKSLLLPARRVELDWVRILAFGLLILYHVGMLYVPWGFHIKSAHRVDGLVPVMLALNPWRLSLLFVVSGVATRFLAEKAGNTGLLPSRTLRLLVPLIFGMAVIVPPQAYTELVERIGYPDSFLAFYRNDYFSFATRYCRPGPCLVLPTWNHLWFIAYLWLYTLLLCIVGPSALGRLGGWIDTAIAGSRLLILPTLLFAGYRLWLLPRFPSTHALTDDWYNHALYATMFLLGYMLARSGTLWQTIERQRWSALGLAILGFATLIAGRALLPPPGASASANIITSLAYGADQWCSIIAILGFAQRWLTRDNALRRYLTEAIFPYYIVHQTAIILIAHQLKPYELNAPVEALVVITGTAASCALTYEIVRRVLPLRPLFGLKWRDTGRSRASAACGRATDENAVGLRVDGGSRESPLQATVATARG